MGWWADVWRKKAEDWTFAKIDPANTPVKSAQTITANGAYVSIRLASLRIVNVRAGITKFYGAVHSYIALAHRSGPKAEFNVLTTPARLKDIDAAHLDAVIQANIPLLKTVPYRGDDIELEVGLFSIEAQNLAGPFLALLGQISDLAGVSYVKNALTFAQPLTEGIRLLTGRTSDSVLEVGLRANLSTPETGYYIVMRAPKGTIKTDRLHVSSTDERLTDEDGIAIRDIPYMVLRVDATPERQAFFEIPELAQTYQELQAMVRDGDYDKTKDALAVFRRTALTSDELLFADARKLVAAVEAEVEVILPQRTTSGGETILKELASFTPFA